MVNKRRYSKNVRRPNRTHFDRNYAPYDRAPKRKSGNSFFKILSVMVIIFVAAICSIMFFADNGTFLDEKLKDNPFLSSILSKITIRHKNKGEFSFPFGPKRRNILLLGVDSNGADSDLWVGTRTDTIILLNVDPASKTVNAISIPRDSKVYLPNGMGVQKINAAHAIGGVNMTIKTIEDTAKKLKVPLIIDEITAGFRICNGGAHLKLGIHPDIAVFSKALGNGFCSSAVIGKKWVMSFAQDAFITSTNWTERIGAVAALAMINKFIKYDVSSHLIEIATEVSNIWSKTSDKYGLKITIGGFIPLIHFTFEKNHAERIAYFTQEMLKLGFLAGSGFYAMFAHTKSDVIKYEVAFDKVFCKLKTVIDNNELQSKLECEPISPGFARIN